jgi:hypothetical protein
MTFDSIWPGTRRPRKLLFQDPEYALEEAWLNVLFLQQSPILNSEGPMKATFSGSGALGVTMNA